MVIFWIRELPKKHPTDWNSVFLRKTVRQNEYDGIFLLKIKNAKIMHLKQQARPKHINQMVTYSQDR